MELPDLGHNCQKDSCNILDFLPVLCKYCKKTFCSEHFYVCAHNCDCVTITDNQCSGKAYINPVCSFDGCKIRDVVEMRCVKCKNHFCLNHRYHSCFEYKDTEISEALTKLALPREEFAKSLAKVEAEVNQKLEKFKKSSKHQSTALKLQLMKLKGKAQGDAGVPAEDRVYFLIFLPKCLNLKSQATFVNRNWTIGKVIDNISLTCKVPNRNNVSDSDKLRLFLKTNGSQLSSDMSQLLSELLNSKQIVNGESLILEFIASSNLKDALIAMPENYLD